MRRFVGAIAVVLLVGSACSSGGVDPLPAPPTTRPQPSTTAVPDYSSVELASVPGRTTTTVAVLGGRAVVKGVVIGPDGPVPGALVRLERLVEDEAAKLDVATGPDGTFEVRDVLGGRYRVRSFRPSDLALVKPEVFFLGGDETKELRLTLDRYVGVAVAAAIAPNPPVPGEPANLLVQVTYRSVDGEGVVRAVPVPGVRVELFPTGRWTVEGSDVQAADTGGRALWRVRCERQGEQGMSVLVADEEAFPLALPPCAEPPPPTTSTSSTSSTTSSSTTSTTRSSTTTTTRPGGTTSTTR